MPPDEGPADKVLIEKKARGLTLQRGDSILRAYRIALGTQPEGAKTCEGDSRTPEGRYTIAGRNRNSPFHRSLRISCPNALDRAVAKKLGCGPGGDIFIHGLPNGFAEVGAGHAIRD